MIGQAETIFAPLTRFPGLGAEAVRNLSTTLQVATVAELAESPHFAFAAELFDAVSSPGHPLHLFGVPGGRVIRSAESTPVEALIDAPLSTLEGIGKPSERLLAKALGGSTIRDMALWPPFLQAREMLAAAVRDGSAQDKPKVFRVLGEVVRGDGRPVAGAAVRLEREGIRKPMPLTKHSTAKTNAEGRFIFEYERPAAGQVDLRLTLLADAAADIAETRPRIVGQASAVERVTFVVGDEAFRGRSSFEQLLATLEAALAGEAMALSAIVGLDEPALARLSLASGIDPRTLVLVRQAFALAAQTGLPAEVFYALGRGMVAIGSLPAVLLHDPVQRRAAIRHALAAGHLAARLEKEADRVLDELTTLSVAEALKPPAANDVSSVGSVLASAGVSPARRARLVDAYLAHDGPAEAFWQRVRDERLLGGAEIRRVQFELQLAMVTHDHVPLNTTLKAAGVGRITDLAAFDRPALLDFIRGAPGRPGAGRPAHLAAAAMSDEDYADLVFRQVEDAFPTAMLAHRIDEFPDPRRLQAFLERNPEFDLRGKGVRPYLAEHPRALDFEPDAAERSAIVRGLKRLERVYRLSPPGARLRTMAALLEGGDGSAARIRARGRTAFVRRYERSLGRVQAERVFGRAAGIAAVAEVLAGRHGAAYTGPPIAVMAGPAAALEGSPFEAMFGSPDFCVCESCQSVFGPAAYLADLLQWLGERASSDAARSALDVLFDGRRADIGTIELSCANADTPLPYIDIVNEALEALVAPSTAAPARQTTRSPAELRAHPEHLREAAYEVLAGAAFDPAAQPPAAAASDAVHPFNLPFNLWLAEARTYLGALGLSRPELMAALQGADAARADTGLAVEVLGMSPLEWDLVADRAQPPRTDAQVWGLAEGQVATTALARVSTLLAQAMPAIAEHGMAFLELADLLRTDFVQQPGALGVVFEGSGCDTTRAALQTLAPAHPGRLHRFIRLQRRLGGSAADLDRAIDVLGGGVLDARCLRRLAQARRLATAVDLPPAELLGWWGLLDTRRWQGRLVERPVVAGGEVTGYELRFDAALAQPRPDGLDPSPYERLFQPASSRSRDDALPVERADAAFDIAASGDELADTGQRLADHAGAVAAALGIASDDLARLLPRLARIGGLPNPDPGRLDLANLSALHRHVSLARAVGLDLGDLSSALDLTGIDPFGADGPAAALDFVDEIRFLRDSGFSIAELGYLLRPADPGAVEPAPDEARIGVVLSGLGAALRAADAPAMAAASPADTQALRARLAGALALVLDDAGVDEALAFIDLEVDLQDGQAPPATAAAFIEDRLAAHLDPDEALARLASASDPSFLAGRGERLRFALHALASHPRRTAAAVRHLASAVGLEPSVCEALLRRHLRDPGGLGRSMLTLFAGRAVREHAGVGTGGAEPAPPTRSELPATFAAYDLLHKVALLLNRLRIDAGELVWVMERGPARGTLDIRRLPLDASAAAAPYGAWKRLRQAVALRDRFAPRRLFDLFDSAADPQAGDAAHENLLAQLERRGRWSRADIEFLVGTPPRPAAAPWPGALGFAYPADWRDELALARLAQIMTVVRRAGLPAATLWDWRRLPLPDADATGGDPAAARRQAIAEQRAQARRIEQAVRTRHDEARWLALAPTLRDRLREQQRDALVGWLVGGGGGGFGDVEALFGHLLLDVQMSACQPTSRIKQAIGSVQLFVQRLLMGLETGSPAVQLSKEEAREWAWRKSYRVWEANRKVFLYPENWLEPELRDDKTPFFVELENELLRNEVTDETAEAAVRGYLRRLDEVARLEIVALCPQDEGGSAVLHVFGRTRGIPATYYHRRRVDRLRWTPWEKVDVGIEGDHLVPVVFNRRLYLFWPLINETALEETLDIPRQSDLPTETEQPKRHYQIRLAWSSLRNEGWAARKMAAEFVGQDVLTPEHAEEAGLLKTETSTPADFFFGVGAGTDLFIEPFRQHGGGRASRQYLRMPVLDSDGLSAGGSTVVTDPDPGPDDDEPAAPPQALLRFRMSGCDENVRLEPPRNRPPKLRPPKNTRVFNQSFVHASSDPGLELPGRERATGGAGYTGVLAAMPSRFAIVPVRMNGDDLGRPFFYQDRLRTFFVEPRSLVEAGLSSVPGLTVASRLELDPGDRFGGPGGAIVPALDPWEYDASSAAAPVSVIGGRFGADAVAPGRLLAARSRPRTTTAARRASSEPDSTRLGVDRSARIVAHDGRLLAEMSLGGTAQGGTNRMATRVTYRMPPLLAPAPVKSPFLNWRQATSYRFDTFYHPYVCTMQRELDRHGLDGLYDAARDGPSGLFLQGERDAGFVAAYEPRTAVRGPHPVEDFDFSFGGAYAAYNWEVFLHVPLRVACRLSRNQRFAEAQRWFHRIFDPTETEGAAPQRFWKTGPLHELFNDQAQDSGPIAELMLLLRHDGLDPAQLRRRDELMAQVAAWRADPFNPHAVARLRLAAYARSVVMKYIDNLVAWGDQLFRRDSMESINEAAQLYLLAAHILGRRPLEVERSRRGAHGFAALRAAGVDPFGNTLVEEIEGLLSEVSESDAADADADAVGQDPALASGTLFFCIPHNRRLLDDYWGRVADRLFKIRHCMNIAGVVRQLRLFEPPLDPALLVRARAAGIDPADALSDATAPLPCYRYRVLSQKAAELCADVRVLGQALLSALEKKDAEALSLLRAGHQVRLEEALVGVRRRQVDEAGEALAALRKSRQGAEKRRDYYRSSDRDWSAAEMAQLAFSGLAGAVDALAGVMSAGRAVVSQIPDVTVGVQGFGGTPTVTVETGGTQIAEGQISLIEWLRIGASGLDRAAHISGVVAGFERREEEWRHQAELADKDVEALDHQIVAAEIRVEVAAGELSSLELQLAQSRQSETFLRDRYTDVELHEWMGSQLSSLYFQSYQLAFDLARRAERAWQFELGLHDETFIRFGHWDGLREGLLSGERLHHDLRRMDVAHLEADRRELELVRHVSLRDLDPVALLRLRRDGECHVAVPEAWFDLATPGHYMRRIRSVALSIPSVTGPYVPVSCTLTLESDSIRVSPSASAPYARQEDAADPRFLDNRVGLQSIVTSQAQHDSGLFEPDLRDERYLPFEGAGAVGRWRLQLPRELRQFDYETISDVVLHIRHTARDGGDGLREAATRHVAALLSGAQAAGTVRLFSVPHDFPNEWARYRSQQPQPDRRFALELELRAEHYPFWSQAHLNAVERIDVFAQHSDAAAPSDDLDVFASADRNDTARLATLGRDGAPGDLLHGLLAPGAMPQPVGRLNLFTDTKTLAGLWIVVAWRG